MSRVCLAFALLSAIVAVVGCNRPSPPASTSPQNVPPAAEPSPAAKAARDPNVDATVPSDVEPPPPAQATASPAADLTTKATPPAADIPSDAPAEAPATDTSDGDPPPKPERIILLTPGGPLLVDVVLMLDGRPHGALLAEQIDAALAAADSDGDGTPTWNELLANADYLAGARSPQQELTPSQRRSIIDQYDRDDDGQVGRSEAAAWLAGDANRGGEAFRVRSSRSYIPSPRNHSRVWPFLDRDGDGGLSADELAAAADTLLKLDADDDQTLTLDELATLREQLLANAQSTLRDATRDAAFHLKPGYVIERLDYLLPDLYSPLQPLSPASFRDLPKLFAQLDLWDDGQLDRDDLSRLLTLSAHLELTVAFHSPTAKETQPRQAESPTEVAEAVAGSEPSAEIEAEGDVDVEADAADEPSPELALMSEGSTTDAANPPPAQITLRSLSPELRELSPAESDRLVLSLGATRLVLIAADAAGDAPRMLPFDGPMGGDNRGRIALMVHDQEDPLFEELDADSDGRLGTREISSCHETLLRRDANGDGALSADELPYTMIVAFIRDEPASARNFYVPPRIRGAASGEQPPAWFRHADLNDDGDVSRREFVGSVERFEEFDANDDGFLSVEEIE